MHIDITEMGGPERKRLKTSIIKEEIASQGLAMINPGFPIKAFENDGIKKGRPPLFLLKTS